MSILVVLGILLGDRKDYLLRRMWNIVQIHLFSELVRTKLSQDKFVDIRCMHHDGIFEFVFFPSTRDDSGLMALAGSKQSYEEYVDNFGHQQNHAGNLRARVELSKS